jgi:hypothetical protein
MKEDKMTLHEAIIFVLSELPDNAATARQISDMIAERNLYKRGDEGNPPSSQIHARVSQYPHLFRKLPDGRIQKR